MYAKGAADRQPTEVEKLVACPVCKALTGMPCSRNGVHIEVPHNKRALLAAGKA